MEKLDKIGKEIAEELARRPVEVDKLDRLWEAAVLIPLLKKGAELFVLFEVRAGSLRRQPGEICFPGGKVETKDKGPIETVIRESCEELGVEADDIELLGELDTFVTFSGPVIHPFVGLLYNYEKIEVNPQEVQEFFTVPLKFFLENEPECYKMDMADKPQEGFPFELVPNKGQNWRLVKRYNVYFYKYGKYVIWGMTARMLYSFILRHREMLKNLL